MQKATTIRFIVFLSLLYCNVATSGGTVIKCVNEKGAVSFAERCAPNQRAIDTGVTIDSRSETQKTEDSLNDQKNLDALEKQAQMTPTPSATPITQQQLPANTEAAPTDTPDDEYISYDDDYQCHSAYGDCRDLDRPGLTPAEKVNILNKPRPVQLPARVKRR